MARTIRVILTAAASVLLVFGGAIFSPSARALAPSTYISTTVEAAQGVQRDYGVPASVALAQSILESGWGDSSLSRDYDNYFGIKCTTTRSPHQSGCVSLRTKEYYPSGATYITDGFRTYASAGDSFKDYGRLLTSLSRYQNAFRYTGNPDQFVREVAEGGYATDPAYADKVIRIMRQYDLYQYNALPATSEPTAAATSSAPTATSEPTTTASGESPTSPSASASPSASSGAGAELPPAQQVALTSTAPVWAQPSASVSASATASASPSASASVTPSASATPSSSDSSSVAASTSTATAPAVTGDVDPASPADISRVVWVIDADTRKIFFTGPVLNGDGLPYANTAFRVEDTTGASLGTVTTDAQGWLGDSLTLPEGWDSTTNFEVKIVIPGGAGTQYTEGATTIENPTTPDPQQGGNLTEADPLVDSATDTGLDRDDVPVDRSDTSISASASVSASASASASASPSASVSASASASASPSASVSASASASASPAASSSATASALPTQPAQVPGDGQQDAYDDGADPESSPAASPSVSAEPSPEVSAEPSPEVSAEPSPEVSAEPSPAVSAEPSPAVFKETSHEAPYDQVPVSVADRTHQPRPSASSAPVTSDDTSDTGHNPVDRSARYVTERLPRTGGPAVIFGLVGLAVTVSGATLLGTSWAGRGRGHNA